MLILKPQLGPAGDWETGISHEYHCIYIHFARPVPMAITASALVTRMSGYLFFERLMARGSRRNLRFLTGRTRRFQALSPRSAKPSLSLPPSQSGAPMSAASGESEPFLRIVVSGEYRSDGRKANYKPYKRYDDEFKCNAVQLLESSGRPISEVAGDLGIP